MSTSNDPLSAQQGLHASVPAATTATPRDPVTGTPATPAPHDDKPLNERAPDEIAHDIRRTRADISETLNEIEARISPHHLKEQVKGTVHETIDEVQDRLNPRHLVDNARRTMIDTIRENPIPSILAGLSLGYLIFNPSSGERDRRVRGYDRVSAYGPYDYRRNPYGRPYASYDDYGRAETYAYGETRARTDGSNNDGSTLGDMRDRTREMTHQASERVSHFTEQAQGHMQDWAHGAEEQMHRARSGVESFVQDNPLAAGAIALGLGALIGGLLPPTPQERAMMGSASERITERIGDAASSTMSQAKEAAQHIAEEAKHAAQEESNQLRASARHIAGRVKETAREEAENVRETARGESGTIGTAHTDGETDSRDPQTRRQPTTTVW